MGACDVSISLEEQIACVKREIAMRKNVYAKRVLSGSMKQAEADREIARMEAVLETLNRIGLVTPLSQEKTSGS
jgi:hypothetical protein